MTAAGVLPPQSVSGVMAGGGGPESLGRFRTLPADSPTRPNINTVNHYSAIIIENAPEERNSRRHCGLALSRLVGRH